MLNFLISVLIGKWIGGRLWFVIFPASVALLLWGAFEANPWIVLDACVVIGGGIVSIAAYRRYAHATAKEQQERLDAEKR